MKIALLIAGYLRGINENIKYLKKKIIQEHDCDIYIHISNDDSDNKYYNKKTTVDFIYRELKPKILIMSDNLTFTNDIRANNLLNQNYKYYWLNEEKNKISIIENITYDVVIKFRPDVHMLDIIDFTQLKQNVLYIPLDSKIDINKLNKREDKYICDIIAYGSPSIMNIYFNYYNHINELLKYGYVNETLLYHYLTNININVKLMDIKFMVILSLCNTIAITGDSGSGKTTISIILKELFDNSFLLECDRYHKWERTSENWSIYTHLNPNANYLTKMQQDVFNLKIGNSVYQVDYDHKTGKFTDKKIIESADNIIVCGLHSLYLSDTIIDIKIYMDTDDNLRIPWKIKRDIQKRGYSIEKIIDQINSRKEDFKKYIHTQKKNADIIINLYTDKIFSIDNFSLDEELNVYLKIGIKNKYSINNIINNLNREKISYEKISAEEEEIYIYFKNLSDYKFLIKTFVLNLK